MNDRMREIEERLKAAIWAREIGPLKEYASERDRLDSIIAMEEGAELDLAYLLSHIRALEDLVAKKDKAMRRSEPSVYSVSKIHARRNKECPCNACQVAEEYCKALALRVEDRP